MVYNYGWKCCVPKCENRGTNPNIRFHRFPKNEHRFAIWAKNINRLDLLKKGSLYCNEHMRVCNLHFSPMMYTDDQRTRLKYGVTPIPAEGVEDAVVSLVHKATEVDSLQLQTSVKNEANNNAQSDEQASDNHAFEVVAVNSQDNSEEVPCFLIVRSEEISLEQFSTNCRLCFTSPEDGLLYKPNDVAPSNFSDNNSITKIAEMLDFVLSAFNFRSYPNPRFCEKCVELLCYAVKLKDTWLKGEEKIHGIMKRRKEIVREKIVSNINKYYFYMEHDYAETYSTAVHENEVVFTESISNIEENLSDSEHISQYSDANSKRVKGSRIRKKRRLEMEVWGSSPYICESCGKIFKYLKSFKNHLKKHTKIIQYVCKVCKSKFNSRLELKSHKPVHGYVCRHCGKIFQTFNEHKSHCLLHRKRPCICEICGKLFPARANLQVHRVNTHERRYKFQCDTCGSVVHSKAAMRNHMKTHDILKNKFECPFCDKRFIYESMLRRHILSLHGEPVYCQVCDREFKHKFLLQRHINIFHSLNWKHTCKICSKRFFVRKKLHKHLKRHHGIEVEKTSK